MRILCALALALIASGCAPRSTQYETYIQFNKAEAQDQGFLLILAKNPLAAADRPDIASSNFMLGEGETKAATYINKHYPNRRYDFLVSLEKQVLSVEIRVHDGSELIFNSKQRFASWDGF
jgi:hypothetical protein